MPFTFETIDIAGIFVITPKAFEDNRGFFFESYKQSEFSEAGIPDLFVQDNHSRSTKNVVRGLHFQNSPYGQGKLVRCVSGEVWDVAVDLREGSSTYGQWYGIVLNESNMTMLYIPQGFAHGFVVLSETADFVYKVTAEYNSKAEGGIKWNDPDIAIEWPIDYKMAIVSEKDAVLPYLKAFTSQENSRTQF